MFHPIPKRLLFCLLGVALLGCNARSQTSLDEPTPDKKVLNSRVEQTVNPVSKDANNTREPERALLAQTIQPDTYCYEINNDIEEIQVRLVIDANDQVTGDVQGTIHNEAAAYFSSYRQKVSGIVKGNSLNVDIATWIEYDQQQSQETWQLTPTVLKTDESQFSQADCEQVNQAFQDENGLEAKDLTASANNINTEQVFFNAGTSSTTVSNSVVRGDRDVYLLGAQGGQQMTLLITALADNAVFDVVDPSGIILGTELTDKTLLLPHTGDYQIIVGGTRGNASYDLKISIE